MNSQQDQTTRLDTLDVAIETIGLAIVLLTTLFIFFSFF